LRLKLTNQKIIKNTFKTKLFKNSLYLLSNKQRIQFKIKLLYLKLYIFSVFSIL
jgi:hypothetical protein